jgi:hypothetical protein
MVASERWLQNNESLGRGFWAMWDEMRVTPIGEVIFAGPSSSVCLASLSRRKENFGFYERGR